MVYQEHPHDDESCFLTGGESYFAGELIDKAYEQCRPPLATSELTLDYGPLHASIVSGRFRIWEEQLARLSLAGRNVQSVETLLVGELGRIRDVRQGPDGFIYLAIGDRSDPVRLTSVVRLEPVPGPVAPPR